MFTATTLRLRTAAIQCMDSAPIVSRTDALAELSCVIAERVVDGEDVTDYRHAERVIKALPRDAVIHLEA